jgi:hypothetical protein
VQTEGSKLKKSESGYTGLVQMPRERRTLFSFSYDRFRSISEARAFLAAWYGEREAVSTYS